MAVLLISGSGRRAGKTSVGCALIAANPELHWVAVKVTPHRHDVTGGWREETDPESDKDTSRYLAAGARRSFLVSGHLAGPSPARLELPWDLLGSASEAGIVLLESGSIESGLVSQWRGPRLRLMVLAGRVHEWKESVLERGNSADAFVLAPGLLPEELQDGWIDRPCFELGPGNWSSAELLAYVGSKLL